MQVRGKIKNCFLKGITNCEELSIYKCKHARLMTF